MLAGSGGSTGHYSRARTLQVPTPARTRGGSSPPWRLHTLSRWFFDARYVQFPAATSSGSGSPSFRDFSSNSASTSSFRLQPIWPPSRVRGSPGCYPWHPIKGRRPSCGRTTVHDWPHVAPLGSSNAHDVMTSSNSLKAAYKHKEDKKCY